MATPQPMPYEQRAPGRHNAADAIIKSYSKWTDRAALWVQAGGDPKYASAMAVVSGFENVSGDPTREDYLHSGHIGLWQVAGGSKDPLTEARQAVALFNADRQRGGTGFGPWKASESKWGRFIDQKTGEVAHGGGTLSKLGKGILSWHPGPDVNIPNPVKGIDALVAPVRDLGAFFAVASQLLLTPEGWRRILKVIIGGIIVLWGINMLAKAVTGTNPAGAVKKVATAAAAA